MTDFHMDLKHDRNHQFDLKHDRIDDSTDSSRDTTRDSARDSPRDFPVLQRISSSALNSLSARKLAHHPSKLDLIDDTTLTSLPLPPPPPKARLRRGTLSSSKISRNSVSTVTDSAPAAPSCGSSSTDLVPTNSSGWQDENSLLDVTDHYDSSMGPDDTFEDLQDPIVLVEDYVRGLPDDSTNIHTISRQKSLASFKQRFMSGPRSVSVQNPSLSPFRAGSKRSMSIEDATFCRLEPEDLEAIFGKIPGSDRLKHCDLCDKPLYEISSIISSTEDRVITNSMSGATDGARSDISHLYNEFVCWECTNIYEVFLNELYEAEVGEEKKMQIQTKKDASSTEKLLTMFNSIRETYHTEISEPPKKQTKTAFSNDLLDRLHYLSTMSQPPRNGTEWLNNLRQRLRWRWRLENLLPNPFAFEKQRNN